MDNYFYTLDKGKEDPSQNSGQQAPSKCEERSTLTSPQRGWWHTNE